MTGATVRGANRSLERRAVRIESLVERSRATLVVGAITLLAALVWGRYMGRIDHWLVQTDELQFVRLAIGIGENHSLDPTLRGLPVSNWNQLYPLVLSPFYWLLDTADAFKAAHWLNALLMASTAVPAYLLAREAGASKLAGYLVAALTVCVPWMSLGDMLRDDVVAYPAFTWAVLAMQRAIVAPGPWRDALAVAGMVLAASARTQLVVLGPVFLLAIALHEGVFAAVAPGARPSRAEAIARVRGHWILIVAAALGVLYKLAGGIDKVLGPYQETAGSGDLLPAGLPSNVAMHLSMVAVGIGVIPVTFALGWALGSAVRPESRERHAYAVLLLVTGGAAFVAASSFVLRNAGGNPYDRYFFYIVPLALVGMVLCINEARRRWWLAAAAAVFFAWIAGRGLWAPVGPPYHQSPVSAFNSVLNFHAGRVGLSGAEAARWGGLVLALAAAAALRFVPARVLLPVLGVGLLLFGIGETRSVFRSMGGTQLGPPPQNVGPGYDRTWIDDTLPDSARVAMLPEIPIELPPGDPNVNNWVTTSLWWDTEFWNKRVTDVYITETDPTADPTPFPKHIMDVDPRTGRIDVPGLPQSAQAHFLVFDSRRSDLRPAGEVVKSTSWALELIRAEQPYRTPWAVFGLGPGDAVYAEEPVRVRMYEDKPAKVTLTLMVPYQTTPAPVRRTFTLAGGGKPARLTLTSGNVGELSVCLGARDDVATLRMSPSPQTEQPSRLATTLVEPKPPGTSC